MMEFLEAHQLNLMLALSSICAMMTVLILIAKALSVRRRFTLVTMEIASMLLIGFDRSAYIYAGDLSELGYYMVRISNFMVFFMTAGVIFSFNLYIADLLSDEGEMEKLPKRIKVVSLMCIVEMAMVVVSLFTEWYYYIDEMNSYHRGSLFLLCYVIPLLAPLIQYTVIRQYRKIFSKYIYTSLVLFIFVPMTAALIQIWAYGLSLVNIAMAIVAVLMYIFAHVDINAKVEQSNKILIDELSKGNRRIHKLMDQTTRAFVTKIESKDAYSRGHSERVAEYSRMIAQKSGLNDEKCDEVYYSALMHDMGDIAEDIKDFPYMAVGARYHGVRYDGKDAVDDVVGDRIPEEARIISVADAYDLMSSRTDFRDAMPQQVVREHFIENEGTLFDPQYAAIMTELIDHDTDYSMKGTVAGEDNVSKNEYECVDYRRTITPGIAVSQNVEVIKFKAKDNAKKEGEFSQPSLILFDSLDGRSHNDQRSIDATRYLEYGEIWFDGHYISSSARNMRMEPIDEEVLGWEEDEYRIEAVKYSDHVKLKLRSSKGAYEVIAALPDSSRFAYISITGEHCIITDINITKTDVVAGEGDIERIAEEISYINRLESDIPNVQVDGFCKAATEGVPVRDGMRVEFHTMSLPSANLVWHCPYILIFYSADGKVNGEGYREYALIRLDGEKREQYAGSENRLTTIKTEDFPGWDVWKVTHKRGLECVVSFERVRNRITARTENLGIEITNTTIVNDEVDELYMALTGDQVALTDIRLAYR